MTRTWYRRWVRVLFGGALLFSSAEAGCLSEALRDVSEDLDNLANDLDGNDDDDLSDFVSELEDLFD